MMTFGLLFVVMLGLVIVAGVIGLVVLLMVRRSGGDFPACPRCGYDVSATLGSEVRCPECGAAFAEVGIRPPGRDARTTRRAVVALIAVSLALFIGLLATVATTRYAAARAAQARAQAIAAQAQVQQAATRAAAAQPTANDAAAPAAPDDASAGDDPTGE